MTLEALAEVLRNYVLVRTHLIELVQYEFPVGKRFTVKVVDLATMEYLTGVIVVEGYCAEPDAVSLRLPSGRVRAVSVEYLLEVIERGQPLADF